MLLLLSLQLGEVEAELASVAAERDELRRKIEPPAQGKEVRNKFQPRATPYPYGRRGLESSFSPPAALE